jgi:hypothetical protein
MTTLALNVIRVVADMQRMRDEYDREDPMRHIKGNLRRAAEGVMENAVAQARALLLTADELDALFAEAVKPAEDSTND